MPIKVDREERPDVDRIYMTFVQATTGGGGWPMSVWLTPELEPFFGGTYFPPENRYGHPGFASDTGADRGGVAERPAADSGFRARRGAAIAGAVGGGTVGFRGADGGPARCSTAGSTCSGRELSTRNWADSGARRNFRGLRCIDFLLRYHARTNNREALDMVLLTLREMAKGGMNDQLGGGFHRYSVDERWFVPHFEKMLYDQAQLAMAYLEAFQITGDGNYADVARRHLRLRAARHDGARRRLLLGGRRRQRDRCRRSRA